MPPIHYIRVFDNSIHYDKQFKSFEARKVYTQWKEQVLSTAIEIDSNTLRINEQQLVKSPANANLVLSIAYNLSTKEDIESLKMLDIENASHLERRVADRAIIILGQLGKHFFNWRFLQIVDNQDAIDLHFNWTYWEVGAPKRNNFKVATLTKGKPIEILTDGIIDFTASSRRERTFVENNVILEYVGTFEKIIPVSTLLASSISIPTNRKRIDLLKHVR